MCSEVQIFILMEILTLIIAKINTNPKLIMCTVNHLDRLTFTADDEKEG